MADEPRRISHMLRSVDPRHQLLRHAAAVAPRERSHVHLTKLGRCHAAQRRAQCGPQPGEIRQSDALIHKRLLMVAACSILTEALTKVQKLSEAVQATAEALGALEQLQHTAYCPQQPASTEQSSQLAAS